jgi:hypothetical protein
VSYESHFVITVLNVSLPPVISIYPSAIELGAASKPTASAAVVFVGMQYLQRAAFADVVTGLEIDPVPEALTFRSACLSRQLH